MHRVDMLFSNIKVIWFPPNCTSVLQSLDQGVIWSFKFKYWKHLLQYVCSTLESEYGNMKVDLLSALYLIRKTWLEVHPDVLVNGYVKTELTTILNIQIEETCDLIDDFENYVGIDDRLFKDKLATLELEDVEVNYIFVKVLDSKFLNTLLSSRMDERNADQEDENENGQGKETRISPSRAQNFVDERKIIALQNVHISGRFLKSTIEMSSVTWDLRRNVEYRQTKINDFFKNKNS